MSLISRSDVSNAVHTCTEGNNCACGGNGWMKAMTRDEVFNAHDGTQGDDGECKDGGEGVNDDHDYFLKAALRSFLRLFGPRMRILGPLANPITTPLSVGTLLIIALTGAKWAKRDFVFSLAALILQPR